VSCVPGAKSAVHDCLASCVIFVNYDILNYISIFVYYIPFVGEIVQERRHEFAVTKSHMRGWVVIMRALSVRGNTALLVVVVPALTA